jgi:hypothetical protein
MRRSQILRTVRETESIAFGGDADRSISIRYEASDPAKATGGVGLSIVITECCGTNRTAEGARSPKGNKDNAQGLGESDCLGAWCRWQGGRFADPLGCDCSSVWQGITAHLATHWEFAITSATASMISRCLTQSIRCVHSNVFQPFGVFIVPAKSAPARRTCNLMRAQAA